MWDTLTTGYLGAPELMTFRQAYTEVVPSGASAGRTKEVESNGTLVEVAETIDVEAFLDYILELFKQ